MSNEFTKDSLASLLRGTSDLINAKVTDTHGLLDPAVRDRLKASNTVIRHGGDTRVLQYHIWDRQQPGMFHKHHFKYEVQYDPFGTKAGTATTNFCIHFYLNKIRIYHERETIVARIRRELSAMRLAGFKLKETDRAFSFRHNFQADTGTDLLQEVDTYLYPLLNLVHPMFSRVMDAFNVTLTKTKRRAVIEGREKGFVADRSSWHYGRNAEFKSNVPPPLRLIVLRRDRQVCQHCEKRFEISNLHADHIIPVARGGPTTLGNLQTLCSSCNQKKGKRLETELCFA